MSYLKIYPKSIVAPQTVAGVFEGMLTLEMEQYGLQLIPMNCAVTISAEDAWHIEVQPISGMKTLLFKQFTECLNHYLFVVLKTSPSKQLDDWLVFKFYFDDIYIDLTGQEPVIHKIPSKSD